MAATGQPSSTPLGVDIEGTNFGRRAVCLAGGIGASVLILFMLSQAQKTGAPDEREFVEDVRAVALPPPPPPPPTFAATKPPPPQEIVIDTAPTPKPDIVRVQAAPLLRAAMPVAEMRIDFSPDAFKPDTHGTGLGMRHVFNRSDVDQHAVPIYRKSPNIPGSLVREVPDPRVTLLFIVNEDGSVENARLLRKVHPDFDALVVEAIMGWRFRPAMKGGKAVRQWVQLPVYVKPPRGNPFSVN